ncbi:uncharacterized protein ACA1_077060 [Acanthamoeba castellanii str. Neff]|uniref:Glycosyltransferase family 2 protein n=1 Tax=Acanthamoeba castellanii (strain ATCC 30010 / Neff) TaxID=1257118 RepID=L8GLD5_ACACF|nr:uncharacterized protein ACA1_077060 [Acanthamoeba castellanii str. Neff]ELR13852.1 hypothetical protein ACA1_077060 [Acanthamoeba castellanii str. Neff]
MRRNLLGLVLLVFGLSSLFLYWWVRLYSRLARRRADNSTSLKPEQVFVTMVTSVKFSSDMWTHWLAHYTNASLGFHLEGKEQDHAVALFEAHGITPIVWQGVYTSVAKGAFKDAIYAERVPSSSWLIETDDDELIEFPKPVLEFLTEVEDLGYTVVQGGMVDHIAADCRLPRAQANTSLWEQYPCMSDITKTILKAVTRKRPIHKGNLFTGGGQHEIRDANNRETSFKETPMILPLHHFKWREGCLEKLQERAALYKKMGITWWIESETFLKFYTEYVPQPQPNQ